MTAKIKQLEIELENLKRTYKNVYVCMHGGGVRVPVVSVCAECVR